MNLDDLKNQYQSSGSNISTDSSAVAHHLAQYQKVQTRNNWLETGVAVFALIAVVLFLVFKDSFYPLVIGELFPSLAQTGPSVNGLMIIAMLAMCIYCVAIPIQLHLSQRFNKELNLTLKQKISQDIQSLKKQRAMWSYSHLWSLLPAALIGVSFFWGLNKSLLDTWTPSLYLMIYFVFVIVSFMGGLWLKKHKVEGDIDSLLEELEVMSQQLKQ